jgi:folate-dependent tRNA-U54 methylase TrmFO/GidA
VNFGLFPPLEGRGRDRKQAMAQRARGDLAAWLGADQVAAE